MPDKNKQVYCVELGSLKWTYATALEAWNNEALQVRKSGSSMLMGNIVTGIKNYDDFVRYLDEGAVLGYHVLKVYKITESEV
ncbi:hypothetical protein ACER0A_012155 [Haloimpatiens sp. FM7315]|uniref:hypothetical protein n=1 Tax=Haloimpatiens sp. FM7315 TaxID=3298609 RepID=UPI0035A2E606